MYLSKNLKLLHPRPWFSSSLVSTISSRLVQGRGGVKFPLDDPTKPPLRLNIPKDVTSPPNILVDDKACRSSASLGDLTVQALKVVQDQHSTRSDLKFESVPLRCSQSADSLTTFHDCSSVKKITSVSKHSENLPVSLSSHREAVQPTQHMSLHTAPNLNEKHEKHSWKEGLARPGKNPLKICKDKGKMREDLGKDKVEPTLRSASSQPNIYRSQKDLTNLGKSSRKICKDKEDILENLGKDEVKQSNEPTLRSASFQPNICGPKKEDLTNLEISSRKVCKDKEQMLEDLGKVEVDQNFEQNLYAASSQPNIIEPKKDLANLGISSKNVFEDKEYLGIVKVKQNIEKTLHATNPQPNIIEPKNDLANLGISSKKVYEDREYLGKVELEQSIKQTLSAASSQPTTIEPNLLETNVDKPISQTTSNRSSRFEKTKNQFQSKPIMREITRPHDYSCKQDLDDLGKNLKIVSKDKKQTEEGLRKAQVKQNIESTLQTTSSQPNISKPKFMEMNVNTTTPQTTRNGSSPFEKTKEQLQSIMRETVTMLEGKNKITKPKLSKPKIKRWNETLWKPQIPSQKLKGLEVKSGLRERMLKKKSLEKCGISQTKKAEKVGWADEFSKNQVDYRFKKDLKKKEMSLGQNAVIHEVLRNHAKDHDKKSTNALRQSETQTPISHGVKMSNKSQENVMETRSGDSKPIKKENVKDKTKSKTSTPAHGDKKSNCSSEEEILQPSKSKSSFVRNQPGPHRVREKARTPVSPSKSKPSVKPLGSVVKEMVDKPELLAYVTPYDSGCSRELHLSSSTMDNEQNKKKNGRVLDKKEEDVKDISDSGLLSESLATQASLEMHPTSVNVGMECNVQSDDGKAVAPVQNNIATCSTDPSTSGAPKLSDNLINVVNESFTEQRQSPPTDSLQLMTKVKEMLDVDLTNAVKLFESAESTKSNSKEVKEPNADVQSSTVLNSVVLVNEHFQCSVNTRELDQILRSNKTKLKDGLNVNQELAQPKKLFSIDRAPLLSRVDFCRDEAKEKELSGESIVVLNNKSQKWKVDWSLCPKQKRSTDPVSDMTQHQQEEHSVPKSVLAYVSDNINYISKSKTPPNEKKAIKTGTIEVKLDTPERSPSRVKQINLKDDRVNKDNITKFVAHPLRAQNNTRDNDVRNKLEVVVSPLKPQINITTRDVKEDKATKKELETKIKIQNKDIKKNMATKIELGLEINIKNSDVKKDETTKKELGAQCNTKDRDVKNGKTTKEVVVTPPGKQKEKEKENFYKTLEKYKVTPTEEDLPMKINGDLKSNPNLKKLDELKTVVLHGSTKFSDPLDSLARHEANDMANLLLTVITDVSFEAQKKRSVKNIKVLDAKGRLSSRNPGKSPGKNSKSNNDPFAFKVKRPESAVQEQSSLKPEMPHGKSKEESVVKEELKLDEVEKELYGTRGKQQMQLEAIDLKKLTVAMLRQQSKALQGLQVVIPAPIAFPDPFNSVPGPRFLKSISSLWQYLPDVSCQATISPLLWFFQHDRQKHPRPFAGLFHKYGPVVRLQGFFGGEIVLIYRPEHIASVFSADGTHPVRCTMDSLEKFRQEKKQSPSVSGPYNLTGYRWETVRSVLDRPLRLCSEAFYPNIEDIGGRFVNRIRSVKNFQDEVPNDLMLEINKWSLECLCTVAVNKSFGLLGPDNIWSSEPARLFKAVTDATQSLCKCESSFQLWRFMSTPASTTLKKACETIEGIMAKYVDDIRVDLTKDTEGLRRPMSLVEGMLLKERMTPDDAMTCLLDILLIGVNMTSSALGFLLYQLAHHQRVQKELFNEVKRVLPGKDSELEMQDMHSLRYLQACLKESLRLNMPMPILTRVLPQDITLSNYEIPKGTYMVMAAQFACLREENFENATTFRPERWLGGSESEVHPFASLPFGYGPRCCIGQELAETQLWTSVAKVVRNFRIEHNYGEVSSTRDFICVPATPLKLSFVERPE